MIARVTIELPFSLSIPKEEDFGSFPFNFNDYKIIFLPFLKGENANRYSDAQEILINGRETYNANVLQIIFQKENFDRAPSGKFDPPIELIEKISNDFLLRLRYVLSADGIKPLNFMSTVVNLRYLNDDGTELEINPSFIRGRANIISHFKVLSLTHKMWNSIHSIDKHEIPKWKILLFDASSILPEIGPSIVLTFTALEVFISTILDKLAEHNQIDNDLWKWINNRGFFLKEPSIEEQFDFLCSYLSGVSIKDKSKLWEAFKNLQSARNSFAHTGIAKIRDIEVTEIKARDFIIKANEIINYLRVNLPQEVRWIEFDNTDIEIQGQIKLE